MEKANEENRRKMSIEKIILPHLMKNIEGKDIIISDPKTEIIQDENLFNEYNEVAEKI